MSEKSSIDKPPSTSKSRDNNDEHRKRRDRSRSSSSKRHRHRRSRSRSRSRSRHHRHHHHHRHRHNRKRSRTRSRSHSRHRTSPPKVNNRLIQNEEEKKRIQLETLQRLKDMAANDTLDLSQLTIDELKKAIEIPKEIRMNPVATMTFQMDEIRKLIEELTNITIPKMYNTGSINPLQYAQQQRKRKLLWSKTNDKTSTSKVGAAITDGQDEKTAEKFRKLLGMKIGNNSIDEDTTAIQQQQQNTFDSLDREYQTARITTHLRRGVGLGFLSQAPFTPSTTDKN